MATKTLMQAVKIALITKEMTLTELSKQLDINFNYMYQVLKGQRNSEEIVNKVKAYLNIQ